MKLCRTCRYGNEYELDKPCVVYRADCPLYQKVGDGMTNKDAYNKGWDDGAKAAYEHLKMCEEEQEPKESDHKCHTCKHYTSGEYDGSCDSYICKGYSDWESDNCN